MLTGFSPQKWQECTGNCTAITVGKEGAYSNEAHGGHGNSLSVAKGKQGTCQGQLSEFVFIFDFADGIK